MSTFHRTRKSVLGYDVDEVEEFLADARRAYDADQVELLRADDIRHTAFSMQKGGFSTAEVDAALERLEDAFATRERERALEAQGDVAWYEQARGNALAIVNRLNRPDGHRFARTGILSFGYNRAEVDRFAGRLQRYFQDGRPMSVEEVRTTVFRPQRGGYRELPVDLLLDSVTEVMLAVR